ncbi:gp47 [Shigella virus Moo19]|uniref:Uncharacterized protein n=1 Tax=Shigella virus Moo19 TaxID=2886042 RepID=A0AAE8YE05_9CAUD|nr:gp47 [Shigella virus Moo19]UEN68843.1 hypothetical protein Moo19_gp47 [Shigella virus Moo19]
MNPKVIHSKTGEAVELDTIAKVEDILACPANIASLCQCIVALSEERKLWLEPNKEMVQAGIAEVHSTLENISQENYEAGECSHVGHIDLDTMTDDQASDLAVFVLQAMAGKRSG